jgi:hypothetical protein
MKYGLSPPMRAMLKNARMKHFRCERENTEQFDSSTTKSDFAHSISVIEDIRKQVVFHQLQNFLANKVIKPS